MKDIILAGFAASGKGTQSTLLLDHFGEKMKYFETWGILRSLQSTNNAIGNHLKDLTANGILVKDEIVSGLWWVFMQTLEEGDMILGDGCFRRIGQTQQIIAQLEASGRKFIVVELVIPEKEIRVRLANRKLCKACWAAFNTQVHGDLERCPYCWGELYRRNDDLDETSIQKRISEFKENTLPTLDRLKEKGYLLQIDGTQPIEKVFEEILEIMGA